MKVIRGKPATGKPPKIICTGCGKRANEAGIAVRESAIERGYGVAVDKSHGLPGGELMMIDEDDVHPLCEECVTKLERGDARQDDKQRRVTQ
jgi:hypothetical protein